jgi:hypothetical protein
MEKNQKICVICGKSFPCPPSDKTVTCSPACRSERARRKLAERQAAGEIGGPWTEKLRRSRANSEKVAANAKRIPEFQRKATEAAKRSPIAGSFETNRLAKEWILISPGGAEYHVRNLMLWARANTELFGKPPDERSARNIRTGFEAIAQTMLGNRGPGKKQRGALTYFGWTLKCPPETPPEKEVKK